MKNKTKLVIAETIYEAYKQTLLTGHSIPKRVEPYIIEAIEILRENGYFNQDGDTNEQDNENP